MTRAAQYVRMSTEHQRYSIEAQTTALADYAAARGYQIVRSYIDAGVSGLRIKGRAGLKSLLADILTGAPGYEAIIVYDVSRWGRFQDPDEAGHYEFLCRQAGVRVDYAAEAFENDQSLTSGLVKHLKRAMAAEYSRELSVKVSRAKRGLARKGYWTNGPCAFGLRRQMVHPDGSLGLILQRGQWKALQDCRVVLVPGPPSEVATVRRIFREYAVHGLKVNAIVRRLNAEGVPGPRGGGWSKIRVIRLLQNDLYAGVWIAGRTFTRLRETRRGPAESAERLDHQSATLVSRGLFDIVQRNLRQLPAHPTSERLLADLKRIWRDNGRLSQALVNNDPNSYSATIYQARFGGLMEAYELVGYTPSHHQKAAKAARLRQSRATDAPQKSALPDEQLLSALRDLLTVHGRLTTNLIDLAPHLPAWSTVRARLGGAAALYARLGYAPSPAQVRRLQAARPPLSPLQEILGLRSKGQGDPRQIRT